MELKKNTFYQYKDADTYARVDGIHTNKYVVTIFSKNFVEVGKNLWDMEDLDGWEEVPKTLQTLCVGDVVVDEDGEYKKVLGVINQNCYVMSNGRESTHCSSTFSVKELEYLGYEPYIEDREEPEVMLSSREKKDIKSIADYALQMIVDRVEEIKEIRNKLLEIQKKENDK